MKTLISLLSLALLIGCGQGQPMAEVAATALEAGSLEPGPEVPKPGPENPASNEGPIIDDDGGMNWKHTKFGRTAEGDTIEQYTLTNSAGTTVSLINYGATVVSVETVDRDGKSGNIVLGHSSVEHWLKNPCYFGCTVGRYANRIKDGVFGIEGNVYTLARNDGMSHLHGGKVGFGRKLWDAEASSDDDSVTVTFSYLSPHGDDRYPGALSTIVKYTLNEQNELKIDYEAATDKPTVVNLTNHSYWNLTGNASKKDVLDHVLTLRCNQYLPADENLIPTGDMLAVAETPMNFTIGKTVGSDLPDVEGGFDHCFVVNREMAGLVPVARLFEPVSGRVMEISTTEPGIQFYTGNFLSGKPDNGGFKKHHGLCLETQHFPDSPNQPHFPSTLLKPGEKFESTTVHKFSVYKI